MQHTSPKQQTKQKQTKSSADRITISLRLAHQRKNKQTETETLSINLTLDKAYTNHWTNLRGQKLKGSLGIGDLKHNTLKKKVQMQRNTAQMNEPIRNTEVQINEEEIGKLPEKEFR